MSSFGSHKDVKNQMLSDVFSGNKKEILGRSGPEDSYHCEKYTNFTKFPCVKISWKGTVSA